MEKESKETINAINYWYQKYLKEKLTWQDIKTIIEISAGILQAAEEGVTSSFVSTDESYYKEVLNHFYEQRDKNRT